MIKKVIAFSLFQELRYFKTVMRYLRADVMLFLVCISECVLTQMTYIPYPIQATIATKI